MCEMVHEGIFWEKTWLPLIRFLKGLQPAPPPPREFVSATRVCFATQAMCRPGAAVAQAIIDVSEILHERQHLLQSTAPRPV